MKKLRIWFLVLACSMLLISCNSSGPTEPEDSTPDLENWNFADDYDLVMLLTTQTDEKAGSAAVSDPIRPLAFPVSDTGKKRGSSGVAVQLVLTVQLSQLALTLAKPSHISLSCLTSPQASHVGEAISQRSSHRETLTTQFSHLRSHINNFLDKFLQILMSALWHFKHLGQNRHLRQNVMITMGKRSLLKVYLKHDRISGIYSSTSLGEGLSGKKVFDVVSTYIVNPKLLSECRYPKSHHDALNQREMKSEFEELQVDSESGSYMDANHFTDWKAITELVLCTLGLADQEIEALYAG